MAYSLENALFQWEEGDSRVREAPDAERRDLERAVGVVLDDLRRRLGSTFVVDELADEYASGTDWATELARAQSAGVDASYVVDAAFYRYAREASNYAGGRARERHDRPEQGVRDEG
jgi:hypothetical protein